MIDLCIIAYSLFGFSAFSNNMYISSIYDLKRKGHHK